MTGVSEKMQFTYEFMEAGSERLAGAHSIGAYQWNEMANYRRHRAMVLEADPEVKAQGDVDIVRVHSEL